SCGDDHGTGKGEFNKFAELGRGMTALDHLQSPCTVETNEVIGSRDQNEKRVLATLIVQFFWQPRFSAGRFQAWPIGISPK
ncbi:hypothetical protein, partial [Mesorhizobium sp. M7D.F.Ca.US.004.03.1.1]|uniref:hypothetical protein n=1 Tax=Mesorhizobium sp. M7D.F.Ca.US.004.03.1.1 TaxID=2496702 RepID=UPI0019D0319F